uniref:Uncharacterized protein n=1 Tax=Marseillevirus sp. TaxID=2809551 RepID=A0AA96IYJ5_9VIRU|nr:hypothetical protein MarFTMF_043 [Marseillevirus sp.]
MQTVSAENKDCLGDFTLSRSVLSRTVAVVDWKMDSFGRLYVDFGPESFQKCGLMKKMVLSADATVEKDAQEKAK